MLYEKIILKEGTSENMANCWQENLQGISFVNSMFVVPNEVVHISVSKTWSHFCVYTYKEFIYHVVWNAFSENYFKPCRKKKTK